MSNFTEATGADHGSFKSYNTGFILSVILTVIPFGVVMFPVLSHELTIAIVVFFALVQVVVHLVFFLHMNGSSEQAWNAVAAAFSALIIVLLVGLSIWIMYGVHSNMLAH
jgi:cytochrome o ubiquinol oxidase operon protein cyoD